MEARTKTVVIQTWVDKTLKQYHVQALLGQGGMGVVYRAHDQKLQRSVALKILPRELTADPERWKRFMLEARAAARISHPAIAQVYDIDEQEGTIFIAMELVEGRTVRQLVQSKELDLLGAIDVALQVAGGLAKAHELNIVHRDIKPANVMVTPDGHAKILDFGLAKLLDSDSSVTSLVAPATVSAISQTQAGEMKGTPAYMSPEQVKGEALDPRSDLFSLGVMLYEMVTYEVPFLRNSLVETMHAVAFEDAPPMHTFRPNLPPGLHRIVARCLQKRLEERYGNARELAEELRVLQRETSSGQTRLLSLGDRASELMERLRTLNRAQYAWLLGGVAGLGLILYLRLARFGLWSLLFYLLAALYLFRYLRHQPQRMLELCVRKLAKIPEVSVVLCHEHKLTVVVDGVASQLYGRISQIVNGYNRKLFFGRPMSVSIRYDPNAAEKNQLLSNPGVQYVRAEARRK